MSKDTKPQNLPEFSGDGQRPRAPDHDAQERPEAPGDPETPIGLEEVQRKASIYRASEDLSRLPGLNVPEEISRVKRGLLEGNRNALLAVAEYLWMEVAREDSELRDPLRRFIECNKSVRLLLPSPLLPILLFWKGDEGTKEWSILNVCELAGSGSPLVLSRGSGFFYNTHCRIRRGDLPHKEQSFLRGLLLYVSLGGSLDPMHANLLIYILSSPGVADPRLKFLSYKILLGTVVDIQGRRREEVRREYAAEVLEKALDSLLAQDLLGVLMQTRQDPPAYDILPLFTTWQAVRASVPHVSLAYKLSIFSLARKVKHPFVQRDALGELRRAYISKSLPLLEMLRVLPPGYVLENGAEDLVALIAEHTSRYATKRREDLTPEEWATVERLLLAWRVRSGQIPDSAVARLIPLTFLWARDASSSVAASAAAAAPASASVAFSRTSSRAVIKRGAEDLAASLLPRTQAMEMEGLRGSESIMCASLATRGAASSSVRPLFPPQFQVSGCAAPLRGIVETVELVCAYYRAFGALPAATDRFFLVVERYVKSMTNGEMVDLLFALVSLPAVDSVLSQMNHLVVNMDRTAAEVQGMGLGWIHELDITPATKTSLKATFLRNVIETYLFLRRGSKISASVLSAFAAQIRANGLEKDSALARVMDRASRLFEKSRDAHGASCELPVSPAPISSSATAALVESAGTECTISAVHDGFENPTREAVFTHVDFLRAVLSPPPVSPEDSRAQPGTAPESPGGFSTFAEYHGFFSPLIILETLAGMAQDLDASGAQSRAPGRIRGQVLGAARRDASVILKVRVPNRLLLAEGDLAEVVAGDTGAHLGRGLLSHAKGGPLDEVSVTLNDTCGRPPPEVELEILSNIITQLREYGALLRLQCLPLRPQILGNIPGASQRSTSGPAPRIIPGSFPVLSASCKQKVAEFTRGLNSSQRKAVRAALARDVTLIQGPPGTGKTRAISALVAHALLRGWRVALCAPSNAAVDMLVREASIWAETCGGIRWARVGSGESPSGARLIFCTLSMSGSSSLSRAEFDLVVVDEACQATEPSTLIPLRLKPSRFVLVGDPQQLPPTVLSGARGLKVSLFERLARTDPPILLDTQYRMHASISSFSAREFYGGALKDGIVRSSPLPLAFVDVAGEEEVGSRGEVSNREEALAASRVFECLSRKFEVVGAITPYKEQVSLISSMLGPGAEVSTVDGFQGQERDGIVFSAVRTRRIGFLSDFRRMNVALTRAKMSLVVIGSRSLLQQDPVWSRFIEHCLATSQVFTLDHVIGILSGS